MKLIMIEIKRLKNIDHKIRPYSKDIENDLKNLIQGN